ncbi:MAG: M15 family metallopeptidase [Polyangiaceae bacterium]
MEANDANGNVLASAADDGKKPFRRGSAFAFACVVAASGIGVVSFPNSSDAAGVPGPFVNAKDGGVEPPWIDGCHEQVAQPFLVRGNWFPENASAEELKAAKEMQERAIRYRTEKYGFFPGFGKKEWNPKAPSASAVGTTFMGLPIDVHRRIVPALRCVERALKARPELLDYHPVGLSGIRAKNTYRGGEVSNHVYGIAIDIDPHLNTCCGCVGKWARHPLCKVKNRTPYERMAMPRGWVEVFEQYGFYWLGHDALQDTMHFEFLGDPDRIER